jgi:cystathionine gamma-synthase
MTVEKRRPVPGRSTLSIWGGEKDYAQFERSTQVPVVHSVSLAMKT